MVGSRCNCNGGKYHSFTTGGIANAATGEKLVQWINGLFGAELVTDENEGLIGKEVIDNSEPEVTHGEESDIGNAEEEL